MYIYITHCKLCPHPLSLFPGWTFNVKEWSLRRTTSFLPSQQSMLNAACSRTPCCSAVPAPVPNTDAFAPAGTFATARWHCARTAYDQKRTWTMEALL